MKQLNQIRIKIWGESACFTRPEMKVERVSYDVITPSAARGVLEAIYWKPQIRWHIDQIHVLNPIRFTNIRRNEVGSKIPTNTVRKAMAGDPSALGIYIEEERQQRAAMILSDVAYGIVAHFEVKDDQDPQQKHYEMFKRRARKGQCFHRPYLGCREFPAEFEWIDGDMPESQLRQVSKVDFGFMLHDMNYARDMTPQFYHAVMWNGVIDVPTFDSLQVAK